MAFLVIGTGPPARSLQDTLARAVGARDDVWRLDPPSAADALRPGAWDGVALATEADATPALIEAALAAEAPLLIAAPASLAPDDVSTLRRLAVQRRVPVTVGFFGPVSPSVAALQVQYSRWAPARVPVSVQVEQHLPPGRAARELRYAVLDGAVTLAHLAGSWPARLSAVSAAHDRDPAASVVITTLGTNGTTGSLTVLAGPGLPARRIAIVTTCATFLLQERDAAGQLTVESNVEPLALAAGAESLPTPQGGAELRVPLVDPHRAVVERFLRRSRSRSRRADDLATLALALSLTEDVWESVRRRGQARSVVYPEVHESPRLRLIRGALDDSGPIPNDAHPRPTLTVVR